jgi:integrase
MLATGLRRGELLALKWSNIDFKDKRIMVEENRTQYGTDTPKDNEYHCVPLTDHAKLYLARWKKQLEDERNPAVYQKVDTIFVSKKGTPLRPASFNKMLDKKDFKFRVTPHMFRHTFVYLSKGKITLSELQEALGHDQSTTTLDIYGVLLSDTVSVADKIDAAYKELENNLREIEKKEQVTDLEYRKFLEI